MHTHTTQLSTSEVHQSTMRIYSSCEKSKPEQPGSVIHEKYKCNINMMWHLTQLNVPDETFHTKLIFFCGALQNLSKNNWY